MTFFILLIQLRLAWWVTLKRNTTVMLYIKFVHRKNDYEYEVLKSLMVIASAANHRSDC